jgi:hypothetical protein
VVVVYSNELSQHSPEEVRTIMKNLIQNNCILTVSNPQREYEAGVVAMRTRYSVLSDCCMLRFTPVFQLYSL